MEAVRVFLDTNIVLDFYTGRMGDGVAKTIVMAGQVPQFELCISLVTALNVLYVSRKYQCSLAARDISELFRILPMDYRQYCDAQSLELDDFEDAAQIECAKQNGCRVIITRDKAVLESGLNAPMLLSPEEFLHKIGAEPAN